MKKRREIIGEEIIRRRRENDENRRKCQNDEDRRKVGIRRTEN